MTAVSFLTMPPATKALARPLPAQRALTQRLPPQLYFVLSALFHCLGPAFAVLLFAQLAPLGVAWLRIATAAAIFAIWRRPWRTLLRLDARTRRSILLLGAVLALMNASFYLAIDRLPLATVSAIEFLGPVLLAFAGLATRRNLLALALAVGGVYILTGVHLVADARGLSLAFANCALFILYVILGHRIAGDGGASGIDRLSAAMLIAMIVALPIGLADALPAFSHPALLAAGAGVGICSSVIPYVCDQLAMARLSRATFAFLLALLPATATGIGILVLRQIPSPAELAGIGLVIVAVALHRE
jgi:inner membrane transporter RhtA